jgi:hypothetical protein
MVRYSVEGKRIPAYCNTRAYLTSTRLPRGSRGRLVQKGGHKAVDIEDSSGGGERAGSGMLSETLARPREFSSPKVGPLHVGEEGVERVEGACCRSSQSRLCDCGADLGSEKCDALSCFKSLLAGAVPSVPRSEVAVPNGCSHGWLSRFEALGLLVGSI